MSAPQQQQAQPPPPPTYEAVSALLEHSAYNPAIVPQLEAYVRAQVATPETAPYHFDANRTLAKLYQFFPHLSYDDGGGTDAALLFLALLAYPRSTDFVSLGCLIPERVQGREPCATLCRCAELLENCQFAEFWPTFRQVGRSSDVDGPTGGGGGGGGGDDSMLSLLSSSVTSVYAVDRLRLAILKVLALSYRAAPLDVVLSSLNLGNDPAAVDAFVARVGAAEAGKVLVLPVKVTPGGDGEGNGGGTIAFVPTADNTKRSRVYKEEINFESIASLMAAAARE